MGWPRAVSGLSRSRYRVRSVENRNGEFEAERARMLGEWARLTASAARAERLEAAVAGSPLAIMCVSAESGRYIFVNEAFARMIGRPLDEVMVSDLYQIWVEATHVDDLGPEREALDRLAKGEI